MGRRPLSTHALQEDGTDGGMQCAVTTTSTRSKEIYLCGGRGRQSLRVSGPESVDASASASARAVRSVTEEEEGGCRSSPSRSDAAFARSVGMLN